jgi:uncharacterized protein (TIGR00369 family)
MSRAEQYEPIDPVVADRWSRWSKGDQMVFPKLTGLVVEELRVDYCRVRLPFRRDLLQAHGIVHGGAIATLMDGALVPAVGAPYGKGVRYFTTDLHVQYMASISEGDTVAEGWVVKRGRSLVFGEAEACSASTGEIVARCVATFHVRQ